MTHAAMVGLLTALSLASASAAQAQAAPPEPPASSCQEAWKACADNGQVVNHYRGYAVARAACNRAARDAAQFGTPELPRLGFATFRRGRDTVQTGVAVAIEPAARFSNAHGAMVNVQVVCRYDLDAKRVVGIELDPRS